MYISYFVIKFCCVCISKCIIISVVEFCCVCTCLGSVLINNLWCELVSTLHMPTHAHDSSRMFCSTCMMYGPVCIYYVWCVLPFHYSLIMFFYLALWEISENWLALCYTITTCLFSKSMVNFKTSAFSLLQSINNPYITIRWNRFLSIPLFTAKSPLILTMSAISYNVNHFSFILSISVSWPLQRLSCLCNLQLLFSSLLSLSTSVELIAITHLISQS